VVKNNAHAKLQVVIPVQGDRKEVPAPPVVMAAQALMENQAARDQPDHPALPETLEQTERREHLVTTARSPVRNRAPQEHLEAMANPAHRERLANQADPARTVAPALLAPLATLVDQAAEAKLAALALRATLARTAHLAAAFTARLLVWPQVTRRRSYGHSGQNGFCDTVEYNNLRLATTNYKNNFLDTLVSRFLYGCVYE